MDAVCLWCDRRSSFLSLGYCLILSVSILGESLKRSPFLHVSMLRTLLEPRDLILSRYGVVLRVRQLHPHGQRILKGAIYCFSSDELQGFQIENSVVEKLALDN